MGDTARLAFVGLDGQLHVLTVSPDGSVASRQVTWSTHASPLALWGGGGDDGNVWPCWSPDGRRLACFVSKSDDEVAHETQVAIVEVDGVQERRLPVLSGRMPIHVQWSPDGARLAVLVQFEDHLELWVAPMEPEVGSLRLVAEGSPLFFGWATGGRHVVLHVGDGGTTSSRLEVRDLVGDDDDVVFRVPPGNFCVPFTVPDPTGERVLYVVRHEHRTQLVSARLDGEDLLGLGLSDGLLAAVPSADGSRVAFSSTPDADGTPYDGISVVPADGTADPVHPVDAPAVAFFWPPTQASPPEEAPVAPLWVQWDTGRQSMRWMAAQAGGAVRELGRFRPTRDQFFHLHFFEQFARSHDLISPCGRWLVWAGHAADGSGGGPCVFLADLTRPDRPPRPVCDGTYAVFAPGSPDRRGDATRRPPAPDGPSEAEG